MLKAHNIYADQYMALGFTMIPTKLVFSLSEGQDEKFIDFVRGVRFIEDDMIQITIGEGIEFLLANDEDESITLKFEDGKLISEFGDRVEKAIAKRVWVFIALALYRNDEAYGHESPTLILPAIDEELIEICKQREGQRRIRVDIDSL